MTTRSLLSLTAWGGASIDVTSVYFPLSGSHVTAESSSETGGRRDTGASLDSVGASSGSLSPLEPPSPLFPPEGSLTSEVFLNVLKLNQNRKRQETRYGTHLVAGVFWQFRGAYL